MLLFPNAYNKKFTIYPSENLINLTKSFVSKLKMNKNFKSTFAIIFQFQQVLKTLPTPSMRLSISGYNRDTASRQSCVPVPQPCPNYIPVSAGQTYVISISPKGTPRVAYAYAPYFPRKKDIGWFIVLGMTDPSGAKPGTLLGLKRYIYTR